MRGIGTAASPRGLRFELGPPDRLLKPGTRVSNWSLRPATVWWIFACVLIGLPIAIEHLDAFWWLQRTPREIEQHETLYGETHEVLRRLLFGSQVFCVLAGAVRASFFDDIRVAEDSVTVFRRWTPFFAIRTDRYRVPVHVALIEGLTMRASKPRRVAFLVVVHDVRSGVCLAGFRDKQSAHDFASKLDIGRCSVDRKVGSLLVGSIHFP